MLAVSMDGVYYHPRYGCESFAIGENKVSAVWKPTPRVTVETEIIPLGSWHIRKHVIRTETEITAAEGGFAIASEGAGQCTAKRGSTRRGGGRALGNQRDQSASGV